MSSIQQVFKKLFVPPYNKHVIPYYGTHNTWSKQLKGNLTVEHIVLLNITTDLLGTSALQRHTNIGENKTD